jgi:hypothetical protein
MTVIAYEQSIIYRDFSNLTAAWKVIDKSNRKDCKVLSY